VSVYSPLIVARQRLEEHFLAAMNTRKNRIVRRGVNVLGKPSSVYKRQTRPLVREDAPQKQDRNCQIVTAKYLVMSPKWGSTPRFTD
jgi:hypothetical protein